MMKLPNKDQWKWFFFMVTAGIPYVGFPTFIAWLISPWAIIWQTVFVYFVACLAYASIFEFDWKECKWLKNKKGVEAE